METLASLDPSDFEGTKLKRSGTVAVLFTADWCPFCKKFEPTFRSAAESNLFERAIVDLTDEENPLWEVFDVRVVPTIIVFRKGAQLLRKDGILGRGLASDSMIMLRKEIPADHG